MNEQWISVKDRLPTGYIELEDGMKELEEYIVHVKGAELSTVAMFDGKQFIPDIHTGSVGFAGEIDYWLPLPEPPKED